MRNTKSILFLLVMITSLMLLSVANCNVPSATSPYIFSPPQWIIGSWRDEHYRFTFTFSENNIDTGGKQNFSKLYSNAKETSDKVDKSIYTVILARSIHIFKKTPDPNIIEYTFENLATKTTEKDTILEKIIP